MGKEETMPSESEWLIMETFWESDEPLTSLEVLEKLKKKSDMTLRMIRVLINRLCGKKLLDYTIDKNDARVYHYFALKSREECLKEKSKRFVNSYFSGNQIGAVATLLQGISLSDEQIDELEQILENSRQKEEK